MMQMDRVLRVCWCCEATGWAARRQEQAEHRQIINQQSVSLSCSQPFPINRYPILLLTATRTSAKYLLLAGYWLLLRTELQNQDEAT